MNKEDKGNLSDGYHTFNELYAHRRVLFFTLCRALRNTHHIWRSKLHNEEDTQIFEGMFIMGIDTEPGNQISYHIDLKYWSEADFAETLENAPKWGGHTSAQVLKRLQGLVS